MTEKMCIKPPSVAAMDDVIVVGATATSTNQIQPIEIQKPNLPKLQIEKFKGDVTTYKAFMDGFKATIHKNSRTPVPDKFNYLFSFA